MSRFYQWSQIEHPFSRRIAATFLAGVLIVILLPLSVVSVGRSLDRLLGLEPFTIRAINYGLGGLLIGVGLSFGLWSNYVQMTRGRGTPLPMLPTHELLTQGPYQYCRNPMAFGAILVYLGFAILAETYSGIGIVLGLSALLLLYINRVEEKELAERFGEAYLDYKREVPFIIPLPPKRQ